MVYAFHKISGFKKNQVVGMAGALDSGRFRAFIAMETGYSVQDVTCMVLGGHGDTMVPISRLATVGGVPVTDLIKPERLKEIEDRTRVAGEKLLNYLVMDRLFMLLLNLQLKWLNRFFVIKSVLFLVPPFVKENSE